MKDPNDLSQAITEECQSQQGSRVGGEPVLRSDLLEWLYKIEKEFEECRALWSFNRKAGEKVE